MMRRDTERYATGWRWLDWLTIPYWRAMSWWHERQWWRTFARNDESWKDARERLRPVFREESRRRGL